MLEQFKLTETDLEGWEPIDVFSSDIPSENVFLLNFHKAEDIPVN
jgi:hypothetical protein